MINQHFKFNGIVNQNLRQEILVQVLILFSDYETFKHISLIDEF